MGVYHGLRPEHVDTYFQEVVLRFNRRRQYRSSLIGCRASEWPCRGVPIRIIANRFLYLVKQWLRLHPRSDDDKQRLLRALVLDAGAPIREMREIVVIEARRRGDYRKRRPARPVLAKERTAFVDATH